MYLAKRTSRRFVLQLAAGCLVGAPLLAACASSPQSSSSSRPTTAAASVPAKQRVSIVYAAWPGLPSKAAQDAIVKDFNATQTKVTVVQQSVAGSTSLYQKLQVQAAAHTLPDLSFMQGTADYLYFVVNSLVLAIDDLIKTDHTFSRTESILAKAEPIVSILGKTWSLPVESATWVMHINKRLFDQAGVPYPKAGWTWDDLRTTAQKLTKSGGTNKQFGFSVSGTNPLQLEVFPEQNGGQYYNKVLFPDKQLFDSPPVIAAFQFVADLLWKDKVMPLSSEQAGGGISFPAGRIAMLLDGIWQIPTFQQQMKDPHTIAPLPVEKRKADWLSIDVAVIFRSTKHPDESWEFLKFMNGEQGQQRMLDLWARMPIRNSPQSKQLFLAWMQQHGDDGNIAWDSWNDGFLDPLTPAGPEITQRVIGPALDRIFTKEGTNVAAELKAAAPQAQALLDKSGRPPANL